MVDTPQNPPEDLAARRAQELIDALWNDKEVGASIRAKAKEKFPDVVIPEDTLDPFVAPLRNEIDALKKDLEEERAARQKEREEQLTAQTQADFTNRVGRARDSYNLTDEGYDKMLARMKETGNYADPDAAAAWVAQQTPPAAVPQASWLPKKVDLFGSASERDQEDFRLLHTNPIAYQDRELQKFVADPMGYTQETFAA